MLFTKAMQENDINEEYEAEYDYWYWKIVTKE